MHIVILGHVCIDRNISEHVSYTASGSPAMFLSKIFKQLPDTKTTIISSYGTDFLPFTKEVSLYPKKPTAEHTLIYENITKGQKRTQRAVFSKDAEPVVIDKELAQKLEQADILYIAPITPNFSPEYIKTVMKSVSKNCTVILSPQGYFRQFDEKNNVLVRDFTEAGSLMPFINFVITSEQDHPSMKTVATEWAREFDTIVIVTTGERGAEVFTKNEVLSIPTVSVSEKDIVDSVGSGDIFSAGFGYWYKKTGNIVQSVEFANKLARECLFFRSDEIKIDYQRLIANT